jgi:glycosyltransferase involved in cell wall biosynthesis
MKQPVFSILLPAYKSANIIGETIDSILMQTFSDFELIICDDRSPDNTVEVIEKYAAKDKRIKLYLNPKNLGYTGNLEECRQKAAGKYLYLMGNDDILSPLALEKTFKAFQMDPDVGAVTRQFYSFEDKDINKPVRVFGWSLDQSKDCVYSISDSRKIFLSIYATVGQLSGLAMRREWIEEPVNKDVFPAHAYPFYSVIKKHKVVQLHDWLLAVRISSSQTRSLSSIYTPSPTYTWVKMFQHIFKGKKYQTEREWGIDYICHDYIGLVQIKNYGTLKQLLTEFGILIKYRKKNLINPKFWFFLLGVLITPRFILIPLSDWYKNQILARKLKYIKLKISEE